MKNKMDKHFTVIIMEKAVYIMVFEILISLLIGGVSLAPILGSLLGTSVSVLFFRVMYLNILNALEKTEKEAKKYMRINYFMRYIMYGFLITLAIKANYIELVNLVLGLLNIKFAIYLDNFINIFKEKRNLKPNGRKE